MVFAARRDSRSIALLGIFSAMVIALEVFPIQGITDLPFYPGGVPFTIDWTGIPIVIVFLALGTVFSLVATAVMGVAIGYRNPIGATFKFTAEVCTIFGLVLAWLLARKFNLSDKKRIILYVLLGTTSRAVGMFIANLFLLPIFYPIYYPTFEAVMAISLLLVPWNAAQAIINILGGCVLYSMIPTTLKMQAGLEEYHHIESSQGLESDDTEQESTGTH